jgi:hypothetical protein
VHGSAKMLADASGLDDIARLDAFVEALITLVADTIKRLKKE